MFAEGNSKDSNLISSVSVIIPTYNRKSIIDRAIQSVIQQTYSPFDIIVIDDGSTDGTGEMIKQRFPTVWYFWQEHQGVSSARNNGIKKAGSEWIAFLDSDDEWLPHKLEKQVEVVSNNPHHKICYTNEIWIRRGERVNQKKHHSKFGGYIYRRCLPLCIISPSSVLIHRSIFEEVGLFDEALPVCEDYDLWLRICSRWPLLYIEEPLIVKYGGHEDQLSRKFWGMDRFRIQALEKILNSNHLSNANRLATLKMLLTKTKILRKGAQKRYKEKMVSDLKLKEEKYLNTFKGIQK